jgi:hypothetical protein
MATSFPKTGPASRGLRAGQRGQASIVVLVLFLAAAAAISAIGTTEHTGNAGRTQVLNRQITDTLSQLSAWYERDGLASLGGTTPDEPALQALLSTKYPALRLAMSTPIVRSGCTTVQDCEPSRQILVWYPATSPQPSAALVNGLPMYQTGGDALWRLYDSKGFVQQRMASAYSQLLGLGRALSAWVTAQQRASVYAQTNYLRASSCSTPGSALPCLSGWTAITAVPAALAAAGMSDQDATAPWGAVIEISNASPDASQVAPYTLAMRLRTPSGTYMTHRISQ